MHREQVFAVDHPPLGGKKLLYDDMNLTSESGCSR